MYMHTGRHTIQVLYAPDVVCVEGRVSCVAGVHDGVLVAGVVQSQGVADLVNRYAE